MKPDASNPALSVSSAQASRAFAKIGLLSFGGPAAQISVMHRVLVEEKKWLSEQQYLHALNFCMLLPGPEAMQLATYTGWLLHGVRGGLIAGLLFILPGLAMMLCLSAIYFFYGDLPVIAGLFYGVKAAVVAIVAQAMVKLSGRALGNRLMVAVAVLAFIGIALLHIPFPLIVLGSGLLGAILWRTMPNLLPQKFEDVGRVEVLSKAHLAPFVRTVLVWGALWLLPLAALMFVLGGGDVFAKMAVFFSQTAAVTFGGAYAVLAYVGQHAVQAQGWLSPDDMLKGLGLAETTLGPLVLVLVFVGFMGGANLAGMDPLVGGLVGGAIAAFFTFVPCFLWIFAGAPFVEALRHVRWLQASLSTITASVVGVIANLALWFGLHVFFSTVGEANFGPFTFPVIDVQSLDIVAIIIATISAAALLRYKINMLYVLAGAGAAGLIVTLL